jgi:2-methylisocitrate lyase-like PEP mutase family enzyme
VSLGPAIIQAALATTQQVARELLEHGTYGTLENSLGFAETNRLFNR